MYEKGAGSGLAKTQSLGEKRSGSDYTWMLPCYFHTQFISMTPPLPNYQAHNESCIVTASRGPQIVKQSVQTGQHRNGVLYGVPLRQRWEHCCQSCLGFRRGVGGWVGLTGDQERTGKFGKRQVLGKGTGGSQGPTNIWSVDSRSEVRVGNARV